MSVRSVRIARVESAIARPPNTDAWFPWEKPVVSRCASSARNGIFVRRDRAVEIGAKDKRSPQRRNDLLSRHGNPAANSLSEPDGKILGSEGLAAQRGRG